MINETMATACTICRSDATSLILLLKEGQKVMRCATCHNAFTYPLPVLPDYASEDFQVRDGDLEKITMLRELPEEIQFSYNVQLAMLKGLVDPCSSVLEIGGGEGIFLELLRDKGYEVEMIEPSISAARRAATRGLPVQNDYLENVKLTKKYQVICMSHVLEHVPDPVSAIIALKKYLAPHGVILLAQTNYRGFMPWLLKQHWYAWLPQQHFSHFTVRGLKHIARLTGLEVSACRYSRLVHGPSVYHSVVKFLPVLQDQIHVALRVR